MKKAQAIRKALQRHEKKQLRRRAARRPLDTPMKKIGPVVTTGHTIEVTFANEEPEAEIDACRIEDSANFLERMTDRLLLLTLSRKLLGCFREGGFTVTPVLPEWQEIQRLLGEARRRGIKLPEFRDV